jgi:serine/threonine protein kinase/tetratricopeptide (TPR) repeat protein
VTSEAPNDTEPLRRGATLGRYTVLGLVGRGAMGDVYAAFDPRLDRKVAVKLVRARTVDGAPQDARLRLLREAQTIAKLSHPNVVVVHDVGTIDDSVFIAMEYVEGFTVTGWLLAGRRTIAEVLAVYRAAGRGLEAAHREGLIHRDFKPENVMIGHGGRVRVMDFGLARHVLDGPESTDAVERGLASLSDGGEARSLRESGAPAGIEVDLDATMQLPLATPGGGPVASRSVSSSPTALDTRLTQTGAILGTPAYMSPEQFQGRATDARTDQFSFCVALYEALYDQRPFSGTTVVTLTRAVLAGNVADAPRETKVPTRIRRALLRGMSVEPAARWPSMTALLDAISYDSGRVWRRMTAIGAVALGAVLVAATVSSWRVAHAPPPICRAGADKLTDIWEAGGGETERKASVRRAFQRTDKPFAAEVFSTVRRALDRYADDWKKMYEEACRATHVRGDQSAEVMDLRMSCLDERRGRLQALVGVLAEANGAVVENAAGAVNALPSLERCADVALLRTVVTPPEGAEAQARVGDLRRDLARVEAMGNAGQCGPGVAAGRALVAEARKLGHGPLVAQAYNALASSSSGCLGAGETLVLYKEAVRAAIASRDDEAAVAAALGAARLLASSAGGSAQEARDWLELARAILRLPGGKHPLLELRALAVEGVVLRREGDALRAVDVLTRTLALAERTLGRDNLEIATALADLGEAMQAAGRLEQSVTFIDRARRLAAQLLGEGHSQVALYISGRSNVLSALGLHAEALEDAQHALAIWRAAGATSAQIAAGEVRLAECLLAVGRQEEAAPMLEHALRTQEAARSPAVPGTRFALARALWRGPEHRVRATSLAEEARVEYQRAGGSGSQTVLVDDWFKAHAADL